MPAKKPNILLITSDQQHYNTLGALNPEIKTPNLDRLAAEGVLFERAYTVNPTCTPSRATIITGKYPSQHGAWSLGTKLPETEPTLLEILNEAGYATTLVGKAHFQQIYTTDEYPSLEAYPVLQDLEFWKDFHGPFYGFQHVELARNHVDEPLVGQHYALWMEEKGLKEWRKHFRKPTGLTDGQKHKWTLPEEFHQDCWIAERTCELMRRYASENKPFFLWASFFDPHPPYLVPEPWDKMYDPQSVTVPQMTPGEHEKNPPHFKLALQQNPDFSAWREKDGNSIHGFHSHLYDRDELAKDIAVYYGMVSMLDKYIGVILDALDDLGLAENTLVVFTTDHGHLYGQHGLIAKGPFHYEDLLRLPMIARMPGRIPTGTRSNALQSLVDLAPTFLSFLGMEAPRWMSGVDQQPVWCGKRESARDFVLVENRHQPTTVFLNTYIDTRYKITVYYGRDYGELFDLEEDPGETNNLCNDPAHAALKEELLLKFAHAQMIKDPIWMPRVAPA